MSDKPQVYVNISGGMVEVAVTRGEVEVIECDWDNYRDSLEDFEEADLIAKRDELATVADPEYRDRLVADMDEVITGMRMWERELAEADERARVRRIREARATLAEAGIKVPA